MEPSKHFPDNPFDLPEVDGDTLMDIGLGPDLVDPQLTMLYPGQQPRERPPDPFASSSFLWDTPMDGTLSLFESAVPSQDDAADLAALAADVGENNDNDNESASPLSSAANLSSRRTSKASRTSSKSSVPSLSSASASSSKKRVRKPSRKKQESQTSSSSLPAAAASPVQVKREPSSGGEEDAKRTKYLERNRVAASKCRQKKKEWVHELEESKAEMEARHVELQREYGVLLGEVSMIKNMLMRHAACKDPNIDQWIGLEAKKFVQKSSHDSEEKAAEAAAASNSNAARRLSLSQQSLSLTQSASASASASRRASLAGEDALFLAAGVSGVSGKVAAANSAPESLNPLSPAASPLQFQTSPVVKLEDINYDHMPDDMFD